MINKIVVVFLTSTPYGGPYSEFRDVGCKAMDCRSRRCTVYPGSALTTVARTYSCYNYYKVDMSPITEKIVHRVVALRPCGLTFIYVDDPEVT